MVKRVPRLRYLPQVAALLLFVGAGLGMLKLVRDWIAAAPVASKPVAQEVRIIRPPPPPPPPPEVEPPPPMPEEELDLAEPEQAPTPSDEPPPGEQLGLDADGAAGADGFGLVARKGGRDLLASGGGAYTWYAGLVKNEILETLESESDVRRGPYSVTVRVWIGSDGRVEQVRLAQSTGDPNRDRAIESALGRIDRLSQGPPSDMPQPITLRIVSRA